LATEAGRALVDYGFDVLGLERICANHLGRNSASGRVLEKLGLRLEGRLRGHVTHFGERDDVCWYGLLREERGA
jgi:RimJ/RimL family protein N-acetyltransferase